MSLIKNLKHILINQIKLRAIQYLVLIKIINLYVKSVKNRVRAIEAQINLISALLIIKPPLLMGPIRKKFNEQAITSKPIDIQVNHRVVIIHKHETPIAPQLKKCIKQAALPASPQIAKVKSLRYYIQKLGTNRKLSLKIITTKRTIHQSEVWFQILILGRNNLVDLNQPNLLFDMCSRCQSNIVFFVQSISQDIVEFSNQAQEILIRAFYILEKKNKTVRIYFGLDNKRRIIIFYQSLYIYSINKFIYKRYKLSKKNIKFWSFATPSANNVFIIKQFQNISQPIFIYLLDSYQFQLFQLQLLPRLSWENNRLYRSLFFSLSEWKQAKIGNTQNLLYFFMYKCLRFLIKLIIIMIQLSKFVSGTILNTVKQRFLALTYKSLNKNGSFNNMGYFNFSSLKTLQKNGPAKSPRLYFYQGWLQEAIGINFFEGQVKQIIADIHLQQTAQIPNDILEQFVKNLISSEQKILQLNSPQLKKWQVRRQLYKAVMFNVRQDFNEKGIIVYSSYSSRMFLQLRLIQTFQKEIARTIVDYICGLPNVEKMNKDNLRVQNFLKQKSYTEEILLLIDSTFQNLWVKKFGEKPVPLEVKEYILEGFRCLFDLTMENYSESSIDQVQERYVQGMIKNQMAFFVTPVSASVFKFLFKSPYRIDALSATKRIGKSHAVLLARILYSYYANSQKRFLFFENLMAFKDINLTNKLLVNMIRNCLHDTLQRKDLEFLNSNYLEKVNYENLNYTQEKKSLDEQRFNKRQLDIEAKRIYSLICLAQYQDAQFTMQKPNSQETKQKYSGEVKQELKDIQFHYQAKKYHINDLIHFRELLNLIKNKKGNAVIVVDQFNYVGRLLYEIIADKKKIDIEKQSEINMKIRQLTLISSLIDAGTNQNIRCLASMHNFEFSKLIRLMGKSYTSQSDSFTIFGYNFSGAEAKFQLQWQLKKIYQKFNLIQKKKYSRKYEENFSKLFIDRLMDKMLLSLSASNIRILAEQLMNNIQNLFQNGNNQKILKQSVMIAYNSQFDNVQESFLKFFAQNASQNTEEYKIKIMNRAIQFFLRKNKQGEKFFLSRFQQYICQTSRTNFNKKTNFHYITTFLCLFKFYRVDTSYQTPMTFLQLKYYQIWWFLILKLKSKLIPNIFKQLNIEPQKDTSPSNKARLGEQLEKLTQDFFKLCFKNKYPVNLANQTFKIDDFKKLTGHVNIFDQIKNGIDFILKNNIKQHNKMIKCVNNQKAFDFLRIRYNINEKGNISIQNYLIQCGVNGQDKLQHASQKATDYLSEKDYKKFVQNLKKIFKNRKIQIKYDQILLIHLWQTKNYDQKLNELRSRYKDCFRSIQAETIQEFSRKNDETQDLRSLSDLLEYQYVIYSDNVPEKLNEIFDDSFKKKN